jgi:hypothetical protein
MADISARVKIEDIGILSDNWYVLRKVRFQWQRGDGTWQETTREAYAAAMVARSFCSTGKSAASSSPGSFACRPS